MEIFLKGLQKDGTFKGNGYISGGGGILEDKKIRLEGEELIR